MNINRHIGASDRTQPATDTFGRFFQLRKEITFEVDLLGHLEDLHRAGLNTEHTAFAVIFIYCYSGHESILSFNCYLPYLFLFVPMV